MKTAEEFYRDEYKIVCNNHADYMKFADAYADYIAEKVKTFHRLPVEKIEGVCFA